MFLSVQDAHVEILPPHGDGRWRRLGHESGAPMNGISALMKEAPQSSLAPSTDCSEKTAV